MPQIFKIGSYWVYFWANENKPIEPIHVHIAEGKPVENNKWNDFFGEIKYYC